MMTAVDAGFTQRAAALRKANHVRSARREIKAELATGERTLAGLIADPPEEILTASIIEVLMWKPGVGLTRARKFLTDPYIVAGPQTKVGMLSPVTLTRLSTRLLAAAQVRTGSWA